MQLGLVDKGWVALRLGRLELAFGDERLIGSAYWANTARTFDAAKLTLRHNWGKRNLHADIFASSVVVLHDGQLGEVQAGSNLHGINAAIDKVVTGANLELFSYWRLAPRLKNESGIVANLNETTSGFRFIGKAKGAGYSARVALQKGSLGSDQVRAWAGHWLASYGFAKVKWTPLVTAEYNYASGDANPKDGVRGTFDQLYPSGHDKSGLTDQVGLKNIRQVRIGVDIKPAKMWSAGVKFHWFWLANAHDALYSSTSAFVAQRADGSAGTFVGQELDATAGYALSRTLQVGAGVGHLFPGGFLKRTTPGKAFTYPYLMLTYGF